MLISVICCVTGRAAAAAAAAAATVDALWSQTHEPLLAQKHHRNTVLHTNIKTLNLPVN